MSTVKCCSSRVQNYLHTDGQRERNSATYQITLFDRNTESDFLALWGFFPLEKLNACLFIDSCSFCNCHWQNLLICLYVRHLFQGNVCKCSLSNDMPTGKPAKFRHSCWRTRRMFSLLCFWGNAMGQENHCTLYAAHERTQAEHKSCTAFTNTENWKLKPLCLSTPQILSPADTATAQGLKTTHSTWIYIQHVYKYGSSKSSSKMPRITTNAWIQS